MSANVFHTKFNNSIRREFSKVLNSRVNDYFKRNKVSRHANFEMVLKSIVMFGLYFIPYALVLSGWMEGGWFFFALQAVMGVGLAGIGLAVMHDANHGAYSKNRVVNRIIGYSLNLVGANATNWKIQHNVKHHTYTNVEDHDEDIMPKGGIIRLSPNSLRRNVHKYQYIYAWFLYGLMTIYWMSVKDIKQLIAYTRNGLLQKQEPAFKAWTWLITTKVIYYSYVLVLPILISPYSWWMIVLGFVVMHYVAGFILAVVFQPAHVIEGSAYPTPDEKDVINENWSVHQLKTTCNFAPKNKLLSWYIGGLNYQIEHHLFPNVCHVHYRKIAKIVKQTAEEFNVPYRSYDTFWSAIVSHGKMLHSLGRA